MKMYQDGALLDSTDISFIGDISTNEGLFFGTDINGAFDFLGSIAEVRVLNSLIDDIVIDNWNCMPLESSHPNFSSLIGYWKMNEGIGSIEVMDYSVNGNTGAINGASWINPDSVVVFDYSLTPRLTDIVPTVLEHLCIPLSTNWGLEGTSLISDCLTTDLSESEIQNIENDFQIFPNPTSNKVNLLIDNEIINQSIQLEIYSSLGNKIYEQTITSPNTIIDITEFSAGVYFFSIRKKDGGIKTKKMIISSSE